MLMKIAHHNDGKEKFQSHTCCLFTVLFIIGVLIFIVDIIADCNWPVWTAVFLLIGWLILVICIFLDITITTDKYRYECIINDSVSYNEVVENYKIIKQRGDIWVLEDK